MYIPEPFAVHDMQVIERIVREHALGLLVGQSDLGLEANHLPFFLDDGHLLAHVARANPIWQELKEGAEVLVVFQGAAGYISPNWYPSKQGTHQRVPTWNYETVHAHGSLHIHDDEKFLRRTLALLTRQHEASQTKPWRMGDAPKDYLEAMMQQIVGIEVRVKRWKGMRKLNQHHTQKDRQGAIDGLEAQGQHALAQAMRSAI